MSTLLPKSEIHAEQDPWLYWARIDLSSGDGSKRTSIFAGISGEDLYKFLNWSQDSDEEAPTKHHLNKWRDSVIVHCFKDPEIFESAIGFYAQNGNPKVLEFLQLALKGENH